MMFLARCLLCCCLARRRLDLWFDSMSRDSCRVRCRSMRQYPHSDGYRCRPLRSHRGRHPSKNVTRCRSHSCGRHSCHLNSHVAARRRVFPPRDNLHSHTRHQPSLLFRSLAIWTASVSTSLHGRHRSCSALPAANCHRSSLLTDIPTSQRQPEAVRSSASRVEHKPDVGGCCRRIRNRLDAVSAFLSRVRDPVGPRQRSLLQVHWFNATRCCHGFERSKSDPLRMDECQLPQRIPRVSTTTKSCGIRRDQRDRRRQ